MDEFMSAPGDFVTNANIGDKAVTKRILRTKWPEFVTNSIWGRAFREVGLLDSS